MEMSLPDWKARGENSGISKKLALEMGLERQGVEM